MKPFALLLAVGTVLAPTATHAESGNALFGGILAGEVACSLFRHGVSPRGVDEEITRITKRLLETKLVTEANKPEFFASFQRTLEDCPKRSVPHA